MLFNSTVFAVFFAAVYAGYLLTRFDHRWQNRLLLGASYYFYGYWDWQFCGLLAGATLVAHTLARRIAATTDTRVRRRLLVLALGVNFGVLGWFKYAGFFADSFADVLSGLGMDAGFLELSILLPVGISFYTFQTASYVVDVYRGDMEPSPSLWDFALYVSFFPLVLAGPIERATRFLPQVQMRRHITAEKIDAGVWLILWGYTKKVLVADNLAPMVATVFSDPDAFSGVDRLIATFAFTVQIYCDFSGYTDMARGVAKLLGFELMVNFDLPYFAVSPSDFWRRWHISLSTWLRDYLYIPLGGNRGSATRVARNLMITMLLGGLWHGASWTFVAWGAYHGLLLVVARAVGLDERLASASRLSRTLSIAATFGAVMVGWVFFRAATIGDAFDLLGGIGLSTSVHTPDFLRDLIVVVPVAVVMAVQARAQDLLAPVRWAAVPRGAAYGALLLGVVALGARAPVEFVYFQF